MASKTTNYNLDMPGYNEIADIDVINGNMDKIDVQMKKNADSAQQSKDIVSDEYSATNTYAVGDYCIHENALYKCKTAITTGEAFDSNKWVQTTCVTEFRGLNSNLDTLEYSDIAGGKNLLRYKFKQGHYSISTKTPILLKAGKYTISGMTNDDKLFYVLRYVDGKYVDNAVAQSIGTVTSHQFTLSSDMYACFQINATDIDANYYNNSVMIEEGTQATPYEPYIPSVKMLAEEVNQQKNDLGGLSFSVSGTTLSITDGTNTWTLSN